MNLPTPPAELEHLASRLGAWGLFKLIEAHGGTRLFIAQAPKPESDLVQLLGQDAAGKLAADWGGDYLKVPLARAWYARCLIAQGHTQRRVATLMRTTENTVRLLLQSASAEGDAPKRDTRQIGLPF